MPFDPPMSSARRDRVLPLDGLRTLAIAFVVLYHLHVPGFGSGFIGVNVFFVLSGYLITTLLLREHANTGRIRLGRFWMRRLLRLYPTLLAVVVVGIALWAIVGSYQGAKIGPVGAAAVALSYTGNLARAFFGSSQGVFSPMWSLSMEEQFYLVWPPLLVLALAFAARRRAIMIGLAVLVAGSIIASGFLYEQPSGSATPDIYFSPVLNVAPLLIGCLLAFALRSARGRAVFEGRFGTVATWVGFAGVVGSLFVIGSGWQQQVHVFTGLMPGVAVASALLIGGLISRPSVIAGALSLGPVAWFGRAVSYPLYLWHVVMIALITPVLTGALGQVLVIVASVGVAIASHYLVERPALKLKSRFEPKEARPTRAPERELAKV
ncbi:acyltransferase family protein [Frigoribacterium sp. 2-23]|uniref:acyltransferase family protein n=1 Tax=Frigoribacterium sp. 2-23 TaxID=3415006 RepID=UPI003C6EF73C